MDKNRRLAERRSIQERASGGCAAVALRLFGLDARLNWQSRHLAKSGLKQPQAAGPRLDLVGRNVPLGGEGGPTAERLHGSLDDLSWLRDLVFVAEGYQFLDGKVIRLPGDRHLMLQRVSIADRAHLANAPDLILACPHDDRCFGGESACDYREFRACLPVLLFAAGPGLHLRGSEPFDP